MFQFGYCLLFWMNHIRALNSLVHNNFSSSFSELLKREKSLIIHQCYLQTLACKTIKVKNNMASEILADIFPHKEGNCNLRNSTVLQGRSIKQYKKYYASYIIQK